MSDFLRITGNVKATTIEAAVEEGLFVSGQVVTGFGGASTADLIQLAADPDSLIFGAITRDSDGAVTSASVIWPDGATGTFTGTASTAALGALDAYVITHVDSSGTTTYTQPALTRDTNGAVTTRPTMVVS